MNHIQRVLATIAFMLVAAIAGCSSGAGSSENQASDSSTASQDEHNREGVEPGAEGSGEHSRGGDGQDREEGEESGTELALNESYDRVRNGARLVLSYDARSNSFSGTVENTTDKTLKKVRVEVHLSNGKELGPTTPADLDPGERITITLAATTRDFDGWTAHPEVGEGEHGNGEGRGEHDREGRGDYKERGSS